ncbi:MAG: hypothetical protein KIS94_05940 [Chitinophagales bacterium]|nr:hypothetical protein [Chitinophagales bacterium]
MKALPAFLFFVIASVASCKKEKAVLYDFSKYTATDISGTIVSIDSTDWAYDATWTTAELKLLTFKDTIKVSDSTYGYVQLSPATPNPTSGVFIIGSDTEKECKMKAVFVNEQLNILHYLSKKFTGGPILTAYDLSVHTAFRKGNCYRMYYGFFNAKDSLFYKGHGDIRIE